MPRPAGTGIGPIRQKGRRYVGRIHWTEPGTARRLQRDIYGDTEHACRVAMLDALQEVEHGVPVVRGAPKTVGELLTKWLAHTAPFVRPATYSNWEMLTRVHLGPELGHLHLSTLHHRDLNAAYERLRQTRQSGHHDRRKRLSGSYVNGMHKMLCAAFLWAEQQDYLRRNPTRLVDKKLIRKSEPDPERIRPLTDSEFDRIVELVDPRPDRALWLLLLTAGMRYGEAAGLKWAGVDLERGTLRVEHGVIRVARQHLALYPDLRQVTPGGLVEQPPKTRASVREINLADDAIEALQRHRRELVERSGLPLPEWVFTMPDGRPLAHNAVNRLWHQIQDQAGIPHERQMGLHGCRRTVATQDAEVGEPKAQQNKLGHVNQSTTNVYVKGGQARLREHTNERMRQARARLQDQTG